MRLSNLIEFIGHLMGAALQLFLIMMMARRRNKRHSENVFFTLVAFVFIWHAGSFVISFSQLLTGVVSFSDLLTDDRMRLVALIWSTAAVVSLGLVPALLIHTLLAFLEEAPENEFSRRRRIILFAAYAPLLLFAPALVRLIQHPELSRAEDLPFAIDVFLYWTLIALAGGSYLCYRLSRLSRDDVESRFYISLVRMFVVIFGLLALTHIFMAKSIPVLGGYFLIACSLAPMFPTIIFSYFILRYNYMEYVLKRSLFYSLMVIFVLAVYILGIRRAGDFFGELFNVDFRIIEAILVIVLILLIDPLREWFQSAFNALFFREQNYYRRVFTELSQRLGSMQGIEVGRLLRYVANSVQAAMRLNSCRIALFREDDDELVVEEASSPMPSEEIAAIIDRFRKTPTRSISLWQASDSAVVREMKAIEATLVLPIYRDDNLAGLMALGSSTQYRELYENEIEMLSILLNHLITAIDNTRLLRDKIEVERRMFANEKWMSLGRLSGKIAHEVKNPLSSIKAITHVMREELPPDDRFYKDLTMVEGEIDKLAGVVNQLLQVARPASRDEQSANLRDIVENVTDVLRGEASPADIEIVCDFDDNIPLVKADAVSIREIIFNLMRNGIQSMEDGGRLSVSVTYPTSSEEIGQPTILIVIHDTGPGIPEEEMSKIFEPFYTTKEGGAGLGLWIVRERLSDLGGRISVESKEGTTVSIIIPIEAPAERPRSDILEQSLRLEHETGDS